MWRFCGFALDRHGEAYELVILSDGAQALRFIEERQAGARDPEPCVILLNVHLPKYDGLEVLAAVRNTPSFRHIQVVMWSSGEVRPGEEAEIQSQGAIFRQKPRDFAEVQQLAAEVFELCKRSLAFA
jgi:CheY-like chemotaxis protein